MPLQNRVDPLGEIVAEEARGTLFGNRGGMFHDPETRRLGVRRWASRRWLCCVMDYPGSHAHPVWSRGYTQLFFLDEVTALAAGHRPCAECRRPAARAFQASASASAMMSLEEVDRRLHAERLDGRRQRRHEARCEALPDGTFVLLEGRPHALLGDGALPWTFAGYGRPVARPGGTTTVLTPPLAVRALRAGYLPLWHPTATADAKLG